MTLTDQFFTNPCFKQLQDLGAECVGRATDAPCDVWERWRFPDGSHLEFWPEGWDGTNRQGGTVTAKPGEHWVRSTVETAA